MDITARTLGKLLDRKIIQKIKQERSNPRTDEVVLISTVDERGLPHFSLLNFLDIEVISRKKILLAVGTNSSTARNLEERKKTTIAFWMGLNLGSMTYIKGISKQALRYATHPVEGFETSAFVLSVKSVLEDVSPKAKLISTMTYEIENVNQDHLALSNDLGRIALRLGKN